MEGSLILDIKSEINYEDIPSVMVMIKNEGKHEDDTETKFDTEYIGSATWPKQEDEVLMGIKQEEIRIKDETPTMDDYDNQNEANRICTVKKPIRKTKQRKLKEHFCDVCPYRTTLKANLTRHISTHTGDKPFACNLCEFKATQKTSITAHMRIHTGEKPFKCNICQYKSSNNSNLKVHIRSHTGEKPYQCNICQYKTINNTHLKVHMRIHTGEKPYACNICQYKAAKKRVLRNHIKTHIFDVPVEQILNII